jgi:hypothetical protein
VFEHAPFYFPPILVYAGRLTNWTHIAVVYEEGTPKLYLNGKLVRTGLKSTYIVHSGVGVPHRRRMAPFQGELGEFRGFDRALAGSAVAGLMKEMPLPAIPSPLPAVELVRAQTGDCRAQVWQPGVYLAETVSGAKNKFEVADLPQRVELTGRWDLSFPAGWGAPERVSLDHLISWSEHHDPGVQHFSGTAVYRKTFLAPPELVRTNLRLFLDLGRVSVIARVELNGRDLGILWKPPFRVDVTSAVAPGENVLQVDVVNLWVNRMIGDEALPEDTARKPDGTLKEWPAWLQQGRASPTGRYTFSTWPLWGKDEPLRESGLLGPVRLLAAAEVLLGKEPYKSDERISQSNPSSATVER